MGSDLSQLSHFYKSNTHAGMRCCIVMGLPVSIPVVFPFAGEQGQRAIWFGIVLGLLCKAAMFAREQEVVLR